MAEEWRARERSGAHTPEEEIELLVARLRRGALSPEELELLVYVGHPAACEVSDEAPPQVLAHLRQPSPTAVADLQRWARGFAPWGHETVVRAIAAPALRALEHHYRERWEDDLVSFDHLGVSTIMGELDPDEIAVGLRAALDAGGRAHEDWITEVLEAVTETRGGAPFANAEFLARALATPGDDHGFQSACELLARLAGLLDPLTHRPPGGHAGGYSPVRCRRELEEGLLLGVYALGSFAELLHAVCGDLQAWLLRP